MDTRVSLRHQLGHAPLVIGVAKPPEQTDGGRLDAVEPALEPPSELLLVQLAQDAVRSGPFGNRDSELGRYQRRRVGRAQAVELGPRLPAELLEVGEPLGREQGGPRDLSLEQRVGPDRHPVDEALDVVGGRSTAFENRFDGRHHALRLVARRRWRLRGGQAVAVEERGVGEGAADVDAEEHASDATPVYTRGGSRRPSALPPRSTD